MIENTQRSSIIRVLVAGAAFVVIVAGMKAASSIVNPMLLALIIAITCVPLLYWLERKGLAGWLALLITIVILVVGGLLLLALVGVSVAQLARTLPTYTENLQQEVAAKEAQLAGLGLDVSQITSLDLFQPEKLIKLLGGFLAGIAEAVVGAGFMLAILLFMLLETNVFPAKLHRGLAAQQPLLTRMSEFTADIRQYVLITTWINLAVAVVDTVFLVALGIPFPLLWGLLAFLLGYIPSIGFWLALIPPFLLALMAFGVETALIVLVGYVLINGSVQNFLQPKLMGKGLNMSPLVIFLSLFFWAWVLGAMGALLAVPLTMMIKEILLEGFEDTHWLSGLMASGADAEDVAGNVAISEATT